LSDDVGPAPASPWSGALTTVGRNGVAVAPRAVQAEAAYRSYEVHQRLRVAQSTEKLDPSSLISEDFARDPYPVFVILRENYPCYRDWIGNAYWLTRYDDVTSVFVDDANFETRTKLRTYGLDAFGRDLRDHPAVLAAGVALVDRHAATVAHQIVDGFAGDGEADIATAFAARYPLALLARVLGLPDTEFDRFAALFWLAQRGTHWRPAARCAGAAALPALADLVRPHLEARRREPGEDLLSVMAQAACDGGPVTAEDVAATLLEMDHETLHGALANLWFLLLTRPGQLYCVATDRRLMKQAYLETLRHSPPVLFARRFTRREVERFGLLLPEGALVICAAGAANRDPRLFSEPDIFQVERKDMCQREPRGQYRADGLPSGIAFGLGRPSRLPAEPDDRPRSLYAVTRDTAVAASTILLDRLADLRLKPGAEPRLRSLTAGEMHTCWSLQAVFRPA